MTNASAELERARRRHLATLPAPASTSLGLSLAGSLAVHAVLLVGFALGLARLGGRGEGGREGAGGQAVEVSLLGPVAPPAPPIEASAPETPSAASAASDGAPPSPGRSIARAGRDREIDRGIPIPVAPAAPAAAAPEAAPSATSPPLPETAPAGEDDAVTDSGRSAGVDDARLRALLEGSVGGRLGAPALGDVALLDEVARCPDPVAGTWTARRYSPEFRDWARFTLRIQREGDALRGTISTRMWRGMASDVRPPPCGPGGWDYTVEMTARGSVHGDSFDFGAREHHVAHVECASPLFGYNPDHFSGTFDAERDELRTVNNDGGRDVDAAYTFRRSSCQP
ncbi:MAG: hypothetical protein U0234_13375 [Sandaracinus sp.]